MAATSSDPAMRRDVTWQAAELYEQGGHLHEASLAYRRYIEQFPSPVEQAVEARHRLAAMHEKTGDLTGSRYWMREIVRADSAAGTGRTVRTRFLAAKATVTLADDELAAFRRVKLVEPIRVNMKKK